jgi:hypothetical protein
MKNIVRLLIAALLLVGAASTASFADGGAPPAMCYPSDCGK